MKKVLIGAFSTGMEALKLYYDDEDVTVAPTNEEPTPTSEPIEKLDVSSCTSTSQKWMKVRRK